MDITTKIISNEIMQENLPQAPELPKMRYSVVYLNFRFAIVLKIVVKLFNLNATAFRYRLI